MKKFWLALLTLTLISSCSSSKPVKSKHRYGHLNDKKYKRVASNFTNYVQPSESMQPGLPTGLPKQRTAYNFGSDEDEFDSVENRKMAEEDTDRFVNGDDKYNGIFKVGNPYQIFGVSYFPQNYEDFEEIGTASWYGDDFHGKPTANGETYNMDSMTAAHPTLPLPSLVRVTNLRNNKSLIVRVNDRGPFAKSRIIDVSEKAAILLEFKDQGTTEVKIELLRNDTDRMLEKLKIKN